MSRIILSTALILALGTMLLAAPSHAQTGYITFGDDKAKPAKTSPAVPVKKKTVTPKTESQPASTKASYKEWMNCVVVVDNVKSFGSGFFVNGKGLIVTNAHVVGDSYEVTVFTRDKKKYKGKVTACDPKLDLALVSSPQGGSKWLGLSTVTEDMVGQDVVAIGAPKGLPWSVSKGIVSALRNDGKRHIVQTDAAVNGGNSGGPLIHIATGKVVGVNSFILKNTEGLNFAVSVDEVKGFLKRSGQ